jgi:hypothetical protein
MEWVDAAPFGAGCSSPLDRPPGPCEPEDWTGEQEEGSNQPQRLVEARARNSGHLMLTGGMRL